MTANDSTSSSDDSGIDTLATDESRPNSQQLDGTVHMLVNAGLVDYY